MVRRLGRTRITLVALAVIGAVAFRLADTTLVERLVAIAGILSPARVAAVAAAALLVLAGHLLRAQRSKIAIDQAYRAPFRAHLGALSIGYLFNSLLPLRAGELVRTFLLARKLRISFLYTFTVIVIERLLDIVLVSALFLIGASLFPSFAEAQAEAEAVAVAIVSLVVSLLAMAFFVVVISGSERVRTLVGLTTSWLSDPLRRRLQFSVWTVVYGFQKFGARPREVGRYLAVFAASWVCYLAATATLLFALRDDEQRSAGEWVTGAVGPFVASSISVGPMYPSGFATALTDFVDGGVGVREASTGSFGLTVWLAIASPIMIIGLIWLFFYSVVSLRSSSSYIAADLPDYGNKLDRMTDAARGMPEFIDGWFRGENLVHVLHELEVRGQLTLVRVFKGGSNAITVLSQTGDTHQVKKIVPSAHADKLRMQRDWLHAHRGTEGIVRLDGEERGSDYYAISLEYRPSTIPFFEYIHSRPLEDSIEVLGQVWEFLFDRVYSLSPARSEPERRDEYVADRLLDRVASVATVDPTLRAALEGETIMINGRELLNFDSVLAAIRSNGEAWSDLAWYQSSAAVHGDLTIDNILVDVGTDRFLLIDPSDDNQVRGPIIDIARQSQSLRYGYEFLNDDSTPVRLQGDPGAQRGMSFSDVRSVRYEALADFVGREVEERRLTEPERRSVPFHVGLLYGRMLSHRVVIDSDTALKYYGMSVVALNTFLRQYQ